jgi:hypothetical protein
MIMLLDMTEKRPAKCPKCFVLVRKTDKYPNGIVARYTYEGCAHCNPDKAARDDRRQRSEAVAEKFIAAGFRTATFQGSDGHVEFGLDDAEKLLNSVTGKTP